MPHQPPHVLLRPANLYLLLSYAALSAVPLAGPLLGVPADDPWKLLGAGLFAWIAAWALCKRPAWFHWALLPAFLALPTELYLLTYYGQGISTHHLGVIAETSPSEALEFLGGKAWLLGVVIVVVLLWFFSTWVVAWRTRDFDWNDRSRWLVVAVVGAGAAVLAYGQQYGVAQQAGAPASATARPPALPHWAQLPVDTGVFARSWPFGLAARGIDFYKERVYLAELNRRSAAFRFGAHQADAHGPQIVVMVLGESSRFDRWSLNGYARQTNPLLAQEQNLVMLQDVITPVSATRLSVPVIISRKPAMQSLKDGFSEKSFLSAFKEAGFKTFWISNQVSFGKFDTPVSVFAKEADDVQFLNLGGFSGASNHDAVMLEPLRRAIADPAQKVLVVLHTLGSHWNYGHRYPKQFDRWQPSLQSIAKPDVTDTRLEPQINNSYDSAILYTDWFLSNVIGLLKESSLPTSLLYVADHGQTLYDKSCKIAFHGHNTQYEFHIPAFAWYSDSYRERFPGKVAQLQRHRKARLSTENMFHTLLDLADIRYPGERLEWSFASPQLKRHKRYVDSYGWTDYDDATMRGDCREVIARGKPLPRG
ncbi:phosphoethanolamine transferase [Massilia yuzhufengensis]|uniref:Phosphoethanolamine transferase for glucans (OPG), alkaline phosphatase superfamily n=1 Tax=Massilia yuzhufengensis TaxID=1164594 RepID=A0A1I1WMB5_9BURK|nr:phosphoethanolamine transferase [Massilia yuzhufengensis]SFD96111.1 Phosphoethanolamine transferase for glucans (OPG), alkaline phosphatase superfamily [Massilia yuzhufengensis]